MTNLAGKITDGLLQGGDPNDLETAELLRQEVDNRVVPSGESPNPESLEQAVSKLTPLQRLQSMSAALHLDRLDEMINNSEYVLKDIIPAGTISLFFGKPNAGKTLMLLGLMIDAIRNGHLKPERLIYINEDDNLEGYAKKAHIAQKHGFMMLNSMYDETGEVRSPDDLMKLLYALAQTDDCEGLVLLFDTLKKFCPLMDKDKTKAFFQLIRRLCHSGATVVLLGHANKHLDPEGQLIFEGVQDIQNDIDIMYSLSPVSSREDVNQEVVVQNIKDRGKVLMKFAITYEKEMNADYEVILESVTLAGQEAAVRKEAEMVIRKAIKNRLEDWMFVDAQLEADQDKRASRASMVAALKDDEVATGNGVSAHTLDKTLGKFVDAGLLLKQPDRRKNNAMFYARAPEWKTFVY